MTGKSTKNWFYVFIASYQVAHDFDGFIIDAVHLDHLFKVISAQGFLILKLPVPFLLIKYLISTSVARNFEGLKIVHFSSNFIHLYNFNLFAHLYLYGLMISNFIKWVVISCKHYLFWGQIVPDPTNSSPFTVLHVIWTGLHSSVGTSLISGTRHFRHLMFLLLQPWNKPFLQRSLILLMENGI